MRKLTLLLIAILIFLDCFPQRTTRIDSYNFPDILKDEKTFVIEMPFGKADIVSIKGDTAGLINANVIYVDVICTDYPADHSLKELNQQRVKTFFVKFPFLKQTNLTQVSFFRQMDGAEEEKAKAMFHGLVIRYRPRQSAAAMKADIDNLDEVIANIESDTAIQVERTLSKADKDSILLMLRLKRGQLPKNNDPVKYEPRPYDVGATGYDKTKRSPKDSTLIISPKAALKRGLITRAAYKAYDWTPWVTLYFHQVGDTAISVRMPALTREITVMDTLREKKIVPVPDSTLLKIFSRTKWKNFTVVGDVTVSMYPYSAQLLLWLNLHTVDSVTNSFVFFNDGDEKPDEEKQVGNTGGIYFKECNSFKDVKKLIRETMAKGSGGDRPENDIEALLIGEKEFPDSEFQVLLADNTAPIKDKKLSAKLNKPVRIILCGADDYHINPDYLELARKTKGSVHLVEQDIYDLASLHQGEVLKVGKKNYKIENGSFVELDMIEK